jgi:hypothetical protein
MTNALRHTLSRKVGFPRFGKVPQPTGTTRNDERTTSPNFPEKWDSHVSGRCPDPQVRFAMTSAGTHVMTNTNERLSPSWSTPSCWCKQKTAKKQPYHYPPNPIFSLTTTNIVPLSIFFHIRRSATAASCLYTACSSLE